MKKIRRGLSIVLCLLLISTINAFALNDVHFEEEESTVINVENGKIVNNDVLQNLIEAYFSARENVLKSNADAVEDYTTQMNLLIDDTNENLVALEAEHSNSNSEMESLFGFNIVDSEVIASVKAVTNATNDTNTTNMTNTPSQNSYNVDVYEWTWVYYNYEDNGEVDRMGYGTDHNMTIAVDSDGTGRIVDNSYDDRFVFEPENTYIEMEEIDIDQSEINSESEISPTSIYASSMNINTLITYADKYVAKQYTTSSTASITQYYNTTDYYYSAGNDCANYVSQCLRAGLMPLDRGANGNYDTGVNYTDDWWYVNSQGTSLETCSSSSWRLVPYFMDYFEQESLDIVTIATDQSNIFPGNPVITGDKGHVAICVGYNSAGKPIINGHTRDVYHIPVVRGTGGSYYYTIKIFTKNELGQMPSDATTISPSSTSKTTTATIPVKQSKFYKFTVSSADTYKFNFGVNESTTTCTAVLYKVSETSNGNTLYMVEKNNGSSINGLATMTTNLTAGEYYLKFYHNSTSSRALTLIYQIV